MKRTIKKVVVIHPPSAAIRRFPIRNSPPPSAIRKVQGT
jgi:hypothetical protein